MYAQAILPYTTSIDILVVLCKNAKCVTESGVGGWKPKRPATLPPAGPCIAHSCCGPADTELSLWLCLRLGAGSVPRPIAKIAEIAKIEQFETPW